MQIKRTIYLNYDPSLYSEEDESFVASQYDMREWSDENRRGRIYVGEQQVTFEVPDNFDPRPHQIADLEAERAALREQFNTRLKEINDRIASLQAIEFVGAA